MLSAAALAFRYDDNKSSDPNNHSQHCPKCGAVLERDWLNLRELLSYLNISNTQRIRLQRHGFIPPPSLTLGPHSPRWKRSALDAAIEAGRSGLAQRRLWDDDRSGADQAVGDILRNLGSPAQPGPAPAASEWR